MKVIGLIGEYNPFHNGHLYHIQQIKKKFPDAFLLLVLNGYFLQRGEISILTKEDKTKLALEYGIDLVLELPALFGTQSADIFAKNAIQILSFFQVTDIIFGSESNDIDTLLKLASLQLLPNFDEKVKTYLKTGINYPTAVSKAINSPKIINDPNDLLGISYAKIILKYNYSITLHTIQRTNSYHDINSQDTIVSASNIRTKLKKKENIDAFIPKGVASFIQPINYDLLFTLLKYKIMTTPDLSLFLTVDEGIDKRLKKFIQTSKNMEEFIFNVKTKRYTYNKIQRMIIHILLGITKTINHSSQIEYIHVLGFNQRGQKYLKKIQKQVQVPLQPISTSTIYEVEKKAAFLYDLVANTKAYEFEMRNKPVIHVEN